MTELRIPLSLGAHINYGKVVLAVTVLGTAAALGFVSVVASDNYGPSGAQIFAKTTTSAEAYRYKHQDDIRAIHL